MNTPSRNKQTAIYLTLASAFLLGSVEVQAVNGNTFYGDGALSSVTTGNNDTAIGDDSLLQTTTGERNTGIGSKSLYSNISGSVNTASGYQSLYLNNTGVGNTGSGALSLYSNRDGGNNTASGVLSLYANTTGNNNTGNGVSTLFSNTTGTDNAAVGNSALYKNTIGKLNTAVGSTSMYSNIDGKWNNAVGGKSLYSISSGNGNSAQGFAALYNTTSGSNNLAVGNTAGYSNQTGSGNVFLGWNAGYFETGSNRLYITNNQATPLLYGQFNASPSANKLGIGTNEVAGGDTIGVWNGAHLTTGGVWMNASSREMKDDIEPLSTEDANAALEALSPVRYVYKNSPDEAYVGFIAEDVPDLVASNDHKSLSPMDIVAVLTTVAKEQKAQMTEQAAKLAAKDVEIAALREALSRQDEQMLQIEMTLAEVLQNQASRNQVSFRD